jgi:DNA-binding transcriptional LysR family regulator
VRRAARRLRESEELLAARGCRQGEISISAVSTAKYHVPMLLAEFRRKHPRCACASRWATANRWCGTSPRTASTFAQGTPPRGLDTIAAPFARHPSAIIAAPGHALARGKRLPLARLAGETFLIRERGSGTRSAMERVFRERRFHPRETIEMSSNETIKQAVMAGMGVSFLSLHTVGLEVAAKRLAVLDVSGTPVMRHWYVIHRERKRLTPVAEAFKTFLIERGARAIDQALG